MTPIGVHDGSVSSKIQGQMRVPARGNEGEWIKAGKEYK